MNISDEELVDTGTFILPPPAPHAISSPSFPAKWVIHIASGPVHACDLHADGVIKFANAMGFKPRVELGNWGHNCRGCYAVWKAKFKEGRV